MLQWGEYITKKKPQSLLGKMTLFWSQNIQGKKNFPSLIAFVC